MKKILMIMAVALVSLSAAAQDWYAGGNVGFWRNATANETELQILPEVGYNLTPKVAIGTTIGYDYNYKGGVKTNLVVFDPYVRYTLCQSGNVKVFCDGGVDLGFGKTKVGDASSDTAVTYGIGIKPGLAYSINDRLSLVAHMGFLGYKGGNDASGAAKQGGLTLDTNNLSFGVYVNF